MPCRCWPDRSWPNCRCVSMVRKLEHEVTEAEAGMRLRDRAIESFVQGVCITDPSLPDNPIIYINNGFTPLTGYTKEEVIGRNCRFLQGPKSDPKAVERMRVAIREQKPDLIEILNYRKDGTPFWNAVSIAPVKDEHGASDALRRRPDGRVPV